VTHLRKLMLEELERRNYSQSTVRAYLMTIKDFARTSLVEWAFCRAGIRAADWRSSIPRDRELDIAFRSTSTWRRQGRLLPLRLFELLDPPVRVRCDCTFCHAAYRLCVQLSYSKRSSCCGLNGSNRSAISRLLDAPEINALRGWDGLRNGLSPGRNRTISRPVPPAAAKTRTFTFELDLS
jgi:hypothetical protein